MPASAAPAVILHGVPMVTAVARRSDHTRQALGRCGAFLQWCDSHAAQPLGSVLDPALGAVPGQWGDLVEAGALDILADDGMDGLNWTGALASALNQVHHLARGCAVDLAGFSLVVQSGPGPEWEPGAPLPTEGRDARPFSLDAFQPELERARSAIPALTAEVQRLRAAPGRVEHGMLCSALLCLKALGPAVGCAWADVGGPADPWHARIRWSPA